MDTFAALALATEPPLPSVINGAADGGGPAKAGAPILAAAVWRQILGIAAWDLIVMFLLMLFGRMIAGLPEYDRSTPLVCPSPPSSASVGSAAHTAYELQLNECLSKRRHLTYVFNTFVFLQIFNFINCRKVGARDLNVFEAPLHNTYFLVVFVGTAAAQVLMCEMSILQGLTATVSLSRSEWGACAAVGATPLLIGFILKLTPLAWIRDGPLSRLLPDEDQAADSRLLDAWRGAKDGKDGQQEGAAGEASAAVAEAAADEDDGAYHRQGS